MTESYYSSRQFLGSNNFDEQVDGRRSHQIFSFNPVNTNTFQRNTIQGGRDIDNIMKRYSNPQGPFQSNLASQSIQQSTSDQNKGPINFLNSQNFDEVQLKQQNSQKYQVNYPNLLDDDTSLMTSLNNDTQIYNGVVNPFMKNFENSIRTDAEEIQDTNQNYDKFHQFEHLDLNKMANQVKSSNHQQERVTFGFNNASVFDSRQSQANNGGVGQSNYYSQVNYSNSERESQQAQYQKTNQNIKLLSSPTNNYTSQSSNMTQQSGQFGLQSQAANFGGQQKNNEYNQKDDDNMILKNINNDYFDDDNNIFGSDDEDLTKQEEQEQRVNQMHAEISVLNDQVHKMLQTYKNQLEKQSDKRQVKHNVKKDASLLSKNYRDIISKFEDLSQNDVSMISNNSVNSRSNMSSFAGYSLLKGNTKKEKEVNVMMNLVEQFLCKFDDDFQNQSVSRQNKQKEQIPTTQKQQQEQDAQYKKILREQQQQNEIQKDFKRLSLQQNQLEQPKQSQLSQQYQIQNNNRHTLPATNNKAPTVNAVTSPSTMPVKPPSNFTINPIAQPSEQIEGRSTAQFNPNIHNDLTTQYAKLPQGILSNQSSSHSNSTVSTQNTMSEMDKILLQHKRDHQDNPFLSVAQSQYNTSIYQTNAYSQGNTPTSQPLQPEIFFNGSFQPQIGQLQLIEQEEDKVKRTQLPQLKQVSSAQAPNYPSSTSATPVSLPVYSQSTRTSGVNQITFTNNLATGDISQQITNHYLNPQKPPSFTIGNYNSNTSQPNSFNNTPSNTGVSGLTSMQQYSSGNTLQVPNNQNFTTQVNITSNTNNNLNVNQLNSNTRNSGYFNTTDQLDLYCTNCDQYFKSNLYFEHVKSCDKDHANKVNSTLDDTFYNLEQSTAIINRLDQKIDKISRNITSALQLQNLPQTQDILSDTIRDLAETLKSENSSVVKKIIKKIEQNTRQLDSGSGNLPQSSSYKLYQYLKRVTNILREKETALEQSAMLKEINLVFPQSKPITSNNQPQPLPQLQQQQQQQNFYAPRYSYQPSNNSIPNTNNNFTRNTISTNQELEKKSKFYDLASKIKNNLPANHSGSSYLISELYEEAKSLPESQWQSYLQQKFNINN